VTAVQCAVKLVEGWCEMAKVKKMGLGGFFGGLLGGGAKNIAKAVSKSPVTKALAGGVGSASKPAIKAVAGGVGSVVKPKTAMVGAAAPKFMSDKLRGGAASAATKGIGSAVRGAGSMAKPIASVGRAAMGALGGGRVMKKGGLAAGHKEADGIAKKGKTKAMAVKMAKGGRTC